jgi:hypothetical protein
MIWFFSAGIMFVFFLDFKLISVLLKRSIAYFNEHKQYGRGEVVGYSANEGSRWYSLIVKILELNDNRTYICNAAKVHIHDYPKGTVVSVAYAITRRGRVVVYLADRMPADESSMSKIFNVISEIVLLITIGLLIAGITTTFIYGG